MRNTWSIIGGVCALAACGTATAQSESGSAALDEVVVTAERRETDLQDTPVAVTAFDAAQIENLGANGLDDLRHFIPNFSISEDPQYGRSNPQFNIRGVGAGTRTAGIVTERPVALYIDGMYYARVQGSLLNVLDAESIEVLRGPQGTLFGRNTTGGAVSYTSRAPTSEFEATAKVKVGRFNQNEVHGMVNLPLSDTVALRAFYADINQDGYVSRGNIDLGDIDDKVARVQLQFTPNEDVTIDLAGTFAETRTNGDARVLTEFNLGTTAGPGRHFGVISTLLQDEGQAALGEDDPRLILGDYAAPDFCILDDPNPLTFGPECETNLESDLTVFSAKVAWDISETLKLTSITGHLAGDQLSTSDWMWSGAYRRPFDFEYESVSQEFQLNYDTDRLNAVAGLIYFSEDAQEAEITNEINTTGGTGLDIDEIRAGVQILRREQAYFADTDSLGIYAQARYSLTDRLDVTAGVRFSDDTKDVTIVNTATPQDPDVRTGIGKESWDNVDWRIALQYSLTDNAMVYLSATEAYKAGIADDSSLERPASQNPENIIIFIPPEEALGYELGLRSQWLDNRLRINLTAFDTEYTNRQSSQLIQIGQDFVIQSVNLGDVAFDGFEGEFAFAATDNLTLTAAFGVLDYELKLEPNEVLANIPEESFTLGLLHEADLGGRGFVTTSLNYGHVGKSFAENREPAADGNQRQGVNPSYGLLNGRIVFTPQHERWAMAIYGTNLTDEVYSTSTSAQTFHIGGSVSAQDRVSRAVYRGRPRSYGIEFTANF